MPRTVLALSSDLLTPVSAFLKLRQTGRYGFLMESATGGEHFGRYSFLGLNPQRELLSRQPGAAQWSTSPANPPRSLSAELQDYVSKNSLDRKTLAPFSGGLVGFIGFDFIREIENFADKSCSPQPVAWLGDYQTVVVFDHLKQQISVASPDASDARAVAGQLQNFSSNFPQPATFTCGDRISSFSKSAFCNAVASFQRHIVAGDIFQGVLSQRFSRPCSGDPFELYRALRRVNPSPFMFYQETPVGTFVGASPELLIGVRGNVARLLPIAGTRPRDEDELIDRRHEASLLADPKERAEHMMLVDLARNDLGRVANFGSVHVDETATIHRFSHVMHMVSRVSAKLRPGTTAIDALRASFPAGTVSGAPKVRALEIILDHEPTPRGFYSGAGGFISPDGDLELCITLRTARIHEGTIEYQTGAGIVADSIAENEYDETVHKARALERAIELAATQ